MSSPRPLIPASSPVPEPRTILNVLVACVRTVRLPLMVCESVTYLPHSPAGKTPGPERQTGVTLAFEATVRARALSGRIGRGRDAHLVRGADPRGWLADVAFVPSTENRSHGCGAGHQPAPLPSTLETRASGKPSESWHHAQRARTLDAVTLSCLWRRQSSIGGRT